MIQPSESLLLRNSKKNTTLQVLELLTPDASIEYNKLTGKGKKVVAVLHATC